MIEVALFPIPNSVNFPGLPTPLHVFEPRYREMVKYCIDNDVMMGVCDTQGVVHEIKRQQTPEEALNNNQATYKPRDVFSAGKVELLEELDDGRLGILVLFETRLELKQVRQILPFNIWACELYEDEPVAKTDLAKLKQTHEKVMQRLLAMSHSNEEATKMLTSDQWQNLSATEFSFMVNGLFGMPAGSKQEILEMRHPQQRLEALLKLLNSIQSSFKA
jgi:Lon protease-like protein